MVSMVAQMQVPQPQALAGLSLVHFSHGYDAGYRQALDDLLKTLTAASEQYIDLQPGRSEDLRRLLYPFEAFLEQRVLRMSPDAAFVEGGLGI